MSRNMTPSELLSMERALQQVNGFSLIEMMRTITLVCNDIEERIHSDDEIALREQYPLLGKLMDRFPVLYEELEKIPGGLEVLRCKERDLQTYISLDIGDKSSPLIKWFEGELDPNFYYCERNEELFIESVLEEARSPEKNFLLNKIKDASDRASKDASQTGQFPKKDSIER